MLLNTPTHAYTFTFLYMCIHAGTFLAARHWPKQVHTYTHTYTYLSDISIDIDRYIQIYIYLREISKYIYERGSLKRRLWKASWPEIQSNTWYFDVGFMLFVSCIRLEYLYFQFVCQQKDIIVSGMIVLLSLNIFIWERERES